MRMCVLVYRLEGTMRETLPLGHQFSLLGSKVLGNL